MKIKSLKINGFGKLEKKEMHFSDGINVIKGKNESGKSTLLKFITSMFYGVSKNKNGKFIPDFDRYKPWSNEEYSGKISYLLDNGDEYEVFREFKKKSPIIYNSNKDDISKIYQIDKSKENMFFSQQTGVTEENFFATCVSEQENVKLSNTMKNTVIQKLSNIVSTGNENISYKKAIEKINKKQLEEVGNKRSIGRPINKVDEEIEKLEIEKQEIEKYKDKKYQVEEKRNLLAEDLEDNKIILDLLRRQKMNLEKTQLEYEKLKIFKELLEEDNTRKERLEEKLQDLEELKEDSLKKNNFANYIFILAIVIITAISFVLKKYAVLLINIIPIILLLITFLNNNKIKKENKKNSKRIYQEIANLEEELETLNKNYTEKQKELVSRQNAVTLSQKSEEETIKAMYAGKLNEEIINDILQTKYEKIVEFIDEKEREQAEYKINEKTIEVDNQNIIKNLESLVEIDEKIEKLYEKKDELLQLNNIYDMVKEEIENSYQEMKENITPDFIEELKNILSKVTNGKYTNLYLDSDNNILIEVDNGSYVPIEMLSIGTIDLIYLSLRISAAKEISQENMPIILDESLIYYDKDRMTEILKYLSKLLNRQILILTCSEREISILEKEKIKYNLIEM